ncbi:MAG: cobalt-precorrin-5B (C(1))-methyltransferase CbiD [Butyrivibrio sp.]|nr:cobalt-precorrin-5B (C(1))-methyltransferase CbiD [Butyrivibrio sp.]
MQKGFTTGSCAAAGAKAATYMLLTGHTKNSIEIETPAGIKFNADIINIKISSTSVSCSVIKDGGDDPDVTTGSHITATVNLLKNNEEISENTREKKPVITIDGGIGIGRVTLPGLDQPVGYAAINHVPREMIEKEVLEICSLTDFHGELLIEISCPEGIELADKTFNPRLGIVGGISILGTTGIVEPMSTKALLDTIKVELSMQRALGRKNICISPGNYGQEFLKKAYNFDLDKSVKCSNFIGDTLLMAIELGFEEVLIAGHIGKLIKVAGGIMNTHSHEADSRMEILASNCLRAGCDSSVARKILDCLNTEEALKIIDNAGLLQNTMKYVVDKIQFYLKFKTGGKIKTECILYSSEYGILAETENAVSFLKDYDKANDKNKENS